MPATIGRQGQNFLKHATCIVIHAQRLHLRLRTLFYSKYEIQQSKKWLNRAVYGAGSTAGLVVPIVSGDNSTNDYCCQKLYREYCVRFLNKNTISQQKYGCREECRTFNGSE